MPGFKLQAVGGMAVCRVEPRRLLDGVFLHCENRIAASSWPRQLGSPRFRISSILLVARFENRVGPRTMKYELNLRARQLIERVASSAADFRVRESSVKDARIFDFGVRTEGGLDAGQALAEICMAGLGWASILPGDVGGLHWPHVFVTTDHPVAACLYSQYAGWQISTDGFFAMGSGPMRAVYAREDLFSKFDYREEPSEVVGVLEGRKLPTPAVVQYICERAGVTSDKLCLLIAPTASQAGNVQVVARSVETALHKLL